MQRGYNENSGSVAVAQLPIPRHIPRMAAPAQPLTQDEIEMQRLIEQVLGELAVYPLHVLPWSRNCILS
jgi:hypothetical protein